MTLTVFLVAKSVRINIEPDASSPPEGAPGAGADPKPMFKAGCALVCAAVTAATAGLALMRPAGYK